MLGRSVAAGAGAGAARESNARVRLAASAAHEHEHEAAIRDLPPKCRRRVAVGADNGSCPETGDRRAGGRHADVRTDGANRRVLHGQCRWIRRIRWKLGWIWKQKGAAVRVGCASWEPELELELELQTGRQRALAAACSSAHTLSTWAMEPLGLGSWVLDSCLVRLPGIHPPSIQPVAALDSVEQGVGPRTSLFLLTPPLRVHSPAIPLPAQTRQTRQAAPDRPPRCPSRYSYGTNVNEAQSVLAQTRQTTAVLRVLWERPGSAVGRTATPEPRAPDWLHGTRGTRQSCPVRTVRGRVGTLFGRPTQATGDHEPTNQPASQSQAVSGPSATQRPSDPAPGNAHDPCPVSQGGTVQSRHPVLLACSTR